MNKNELKRRWLTANGEKIQNETIKCLERGFPLSTIIGLGKFCGRWDLRGMKLSTLTKENKVKIEGYSHSQKYGTLKLKDNTLSSIDFSYTDISYSCWEKVRVENCLFEGTNGKEIRIIASDFKQCIFRNANLSQSYFNINIGNDAGSIIQVEFLNTNLSKVLFYFAQIENCLFDGCKIKETDFDGSRFKDCLFKGKIDSAWFKGYSKNARKPILNVFNKSSFSQIRNEMINVDFTECELDDVMFENGIKLEKCSFPNDDKYIIIKDVPTVYRKLTDLIESKWEGEYKRIALFWIENLYFSDKKKEMSIDIVNKECITNFFPKKLYTDFFEALCFVNKGVIPR